MSVPAIDISKLAPEERLKLIGDLWESLRAQADAVHLTAAQKAELDRRLDSLDSGSPMSSPGTRPSAGFAADSSE